MNRKLSDINSLRLNLCIFLCLLFHTVKLYGSDESLSDLQNILLSNLTERTDSIFINNFTDDLDNLLRHEFNTSKVENFYDSVKTPKDYFIQLENVLGWNFRECIKRYYQSNILNTKIDNDQGSWRQYNTRRFVIYYNSNYFESQKLLLIGSYLESEIDNIQVQLYIDTNSVDLSSLLIRSFYPDNLKWYEIPETPEITQSKIQVILFPSLEEYISFFGEEDVEKYIGGSCSFSIYRRPDSKAKNVYYNLRIAAIFTGFSAFPFLTHELAHALRFIYYTNLNNIDAELSKIDSFYNELGREAYYKGFWEVFRERIPGANGILEEAIAYRAMLQTGAIARAQIIPPIGHLLTGKLKSNSTYISSGAKSNVDIGILSLIAQKFGISHAAERKIGDTVFAWSDFISYLETSFSPDKMRHFYNLKSQDISLEFKGIFGISIQQAEVQWIKYRTK